MSVWLAIPSARPKEEAEPILNLWRQRGYKIALMRQGEHLDCDLAVPVDSYKGWALSTNHLALSILALDKDAQWIVIGGDDQAPVLDKPPFAIAQECNDYFSWRKGKPVQTPATFGVMQPTGDRSGEGYIDTSAASAWIGRDFIKWAYGGKGPLWPHYFHYWADTELQCVAEGFGAYWQRPDLAQEHRHWSRSAGAKIPEILLAPAKYYDSDRATFLARKLAGFPGHEVTE